MKFSKDSKQPELLAELTEHEFDSFLHEIDDFVGEAPGLTVSSDFLPRVVELARLEVQIHQPSWSVKQWFFDLSLTMRVAMASAVFLAGLGGVRAGHAVTEIIAHPTKQPANEIIDPLGLAISEQAIVQLMHNDGLTTHGQSSKPAGEQQ